MAGWGKSGGVEVPRLRPLPASIAYALDICAQMLRFVAHEPMPASRLAMPPDEMRQIALIFYAQLDVTNY